MNAASHTPMAGQQVIIDFSQVGTAGPFPVVDGRVSLPDSTMQDLARMLRPTFESERQAQPGAVYAELPVPNYPKSGGFPGTFAEAQMRDFADRTYALRMQAAPKAAPEWCPGCSPDNCMGCHIPSNDAPKAALEVGNSGFDHKTAADFLNGKTISDEAVRKFVAASRRAHDEKAALSAMLLSVRGELASREAEITLLKKALLEAEATPQPAVVQEFESVLDEVDQLLASTDCAGQSAWHGRVARRVKDALSGARAALASRQEGK